MTGIYIHWPYCLSKCPYCDFYSKVDSNINQDELIDTYLKDLDFYNKYTDDEVSTIFFGGGTPSLITPQNIERIINHIYKNYKTKKDVEISLEANPNTNHKTLFSDLRQAGINRLSLGVQSLNATNLKFLERSHNKEQALKAIDEVLNTFNNHSMDIMIGLKEPEDIAHINTLGFNHLSIYQLTIEEGTVFYKRGYEELEEDKAVELYKKTQQQLSNYNKYEVSNFAKEGFECKHNMGYWQGKNYLGIGNGAHGRINLMATTHPRVIEHLSPQERAEELILMGLRITEGINKKRFYNQCGINFSDAINQKNLNNLKKQNLVFEDDTTIKATEEGFFLLNKIILELIA